MSAVEVLERPLQLGALPLGRESEYWRGPLGAEALKSTLDYFDTRCFIPEEPTRRGINHTGLVTFVLHFEENYGLYFKTRSIEKDPEDHHLVGYTDLVSSIIELYGNESDNRELALGYYAEDHLRPRGNDEINPEHVYPHNGMHGKPWRAIGHVASLVA